jgi:hypothetical protein
VTGANEAGSEATTSSRDADESEDSGTSALDTGDGDGTGDGESSGDGDGDATGEDDCTPSSGVTVIDDDVGRDESTCLTWTRTIQGQGNPWPGISQHCEQLVMGGYDDWRVPTTREALTWPQELAPDTYWDAALTSPRYVPPETPPADVEGSFHVCAVAWFNGVDATCQWWGPANVNGTFCVRGEGSALPEIPATCASTCSTAEGWDVVGD